MDAYFQHQVHLSQSRLIYSQCSEYPQRGYQKHNILVTGILKTRGYPKRCDTFRLNETWSFPFISDNFSEVYGQASHFGPTTFIAVFLICPNHLAHKVFLKCLHETIEEKLASVSDLGKLVASSHKWKSTSKIPETLHIILMETGYSGVWRRADNDSQLFTLFIEIFKKRWSSLDLISITREFERTWPNNLEVMDNLSTLSRFQEVNKKIVIQIMVYNLIIL